MSRALVVDDHPDNLYYLQALLEGHGWEVATARHGAEALVVARNDMPDVIVSDLLMPVMDGYTLLRHWKSDPRLARVPFMVYTATYTEPQDERLALSLGADAFLLKPAEPDVFLDRVRGLVAGAQAGTSPSRPDALDDEPDLLKVYSQTLVRKLEEKSLQLEVANRTLEEEIAERRRIADRQTSILDALPAHIALIDGEGRILVVNESWRRFAEINDLASPDFGVGSNYLAVADHAMGRCAEEAPAAARGIRDVLAGSVGQFTLEYPCHSPGERRWFRLMVTPLQRDPRAGAVVMHLDVTDRHLAQEALEQSVAEQRQLAATLEAQRARLAEAQAVANMGSWDTDLQTMDVIWSEETHCIFETDPETFQPTHRAFLQRVHPDDRSAVEAAFSRSLAAEDGHTIDHRIMLADGRVKHIQERWRVIRDGDGRPARASGTALDITARVAAEATLRESEERFRQLAETITEVFWLTDPDKSRMLYVSPAYEVIWGRPRDLLYADVGAWVDAIHPEDQGTVIAALPRQRMGEYDVTYRVVRPDGSERWVHDRAYPVLDASGRVSRVVGLAQDITERKLIESQFLRAQRMDSLGTLAGGIAHDLNNVLTPILMAVDLLRVDESPEIRESTLDAIEASARKGAEMIRQVLSFARGGVEGRRVEVDLEELVRDVVRMSDDTFLRAVRLRTSLPADLPAIAGDPTQLHQVLLNLVVNARDAMPRGGDLTITAGRREVDEVYAVLRDDVRPGCYVAISVADTGTGMTPDVLERIFDPFFTTKEPGKGTGLGLSTSLAIVRSHGGFIHVDTSPGAGSVFIVCLPEAAPASVARADARETAAPRGDGQLILVVEDEATVREVTRQVLERNGYVVHLAADGEEAVRLFAARREEVAAVITDMMMPGMDGRATVAALRAIEPALPIVLVSGLDQDAAIDAAPIRYLAKPYSTSELLRALETELRRG